MKQQSLQLVKTENKRPAFIHNLSDIRSRATKSKNTVAKGEIKKTSPKTARNKSKEADSTSKTTEDPKKS